MMYSYHHHRCCCLFVAIIVLIIIDNGCCLSLMKCFVRYGNEDIVWYKPFHKQWNVNSEINCLKQCQIFKYKCKSVVYDTRQSICNVFDQDGSISPAFVVSAFKKVYFRLHNIDCIENASIDIFNTSSKPTKHNHSTTVATTTIKSSRKVVGQMPLNTQQFIRITTTNTPSKTIESICDGDHLILTAFENTIIVDDRARMIKATQNECRKRCIHLSQNRCTSFTYSEIDQQCVLSYRQLNSPTVTIKKSKNADFSTKTYIKFCYPVSLQAFAVCPDMISFLDYAIDGSIREQFDNLPTDYIGLRGCIELCVLSVDFHCKSISFSFLTGRCLLRDANSLTAPTQFKEHNETQMIYVENSCSKWNGSLDELNKSDVQVRRFNDYSSLTSFPFAIEPVRLNFDEIDTKPV